MEKRSMRGSLAIVFLFYYIDMQQNNLNSQSIIKLHTQVTMVTNITSSEHSNAISIFRPKHK